MADNNKKNDVHPPIEDILCPAFMAENTKFSSFEHMMETAGVLVVNEHISDEDFEKLEACVINHTSFASWQELMKKALAAKNITL